MSDTYYALEKFAEMDRTLISIIEAMPIKRRAIDIYTQKNNIQRAKDTFADLEQLKVKLLNTVRDLRLLFSECDMPCCKKSTRPYAFQQKQLALFSNQF